MVLLCSKVAELSDRLWLVQARLGMMLGGRGMVHSPHALVQEYEEAGDEK